MINPDSFDMANPFNLLRILVGIYFLPHVTNLVVNRAAVIGLFEKAGLSPAPFLVSVTFVMEAVCCIALVLGVYTPWAAALAAIVLFVAAYAIFKTQGLKWLWVNGGLEFPIFWALVCVIVAIAHLP